jgi:hypothetical protein
MIGKKWQEYKKANLTQPPRRVSSRNKAPKRSSLSAQTTTHSRAADSKFEHDDDDTDDRDIDPTDSIIHIDDRQEAKKLRLIENELSDIKKSLSVLKGADQPQHTTPTYTSATSRCYSSHNSNSHLQTSLSHHSRC